MGPDEPIRAKAKTKERRHCECDDGAAESEEVTIVAPENPYMTRRPLKDRPRAVEIQDLIARADDYVSIADDGNAVIAKAIEKVMSRAEVEHVETLVALHNGRLHGRHPFVLEKVKGLEAVEDEESKDDSESTSDTGSTSQPLGEGPPTPCVPNLTFSAYWWGFRIHFDHCACNVLKLGGNVSGAASVVTQLLATAGLAVVNPWVALAVGLILLVINWLIWADGYCTPNSGANYNQSWTVQGWVTTVC